MMHKQYNLNCGQYVLTMHGQCVGPVLDELGLCFSKFGDGVLLKYGEARNIEAWLHKTRDDLVSKGSLELANQLFVITGRFPLDEVNSLIRNGSYAPIFLEKLARGSIQLIPFY